ncbi:MAG: PucR family transcriptional regulator [Methyloligellaceae bacterium]
MAFIIKETKEQWPPLSPGVRELFRRGAEKVLDISDDWFEKMDNAILSKKGYISGDPVLTARTRRHNRLNVLHWATANIKAPGEPVEPNIGPELPNIARDLVRRGATESALSVYRTGQNWAWRKWISIIFELTDNHEDLHDLLQASARSISSFVDASIDTLASQMAKEREELLQGSQADYREVIKLILTHAPVSLQNASQRLGYRLDQLHRAAIIWGEETIPDARHLDNAVELLLQSAGSPRALAIVADSATRWVWIPEWNPDLETLQKQVSDLKNVRIALGTSGHGLDGFRRSHWEAITTQRIFAGSESEDSVADYDAVRVVALMIPDHARIRRFLHDTLGGLLAAEPVLQKSIHTFLASGCNIGKSAQSLGLHRNTLVRHLERAEELLPKPLENCRIRVAMALEIMLWLPAKSK